MCKNNGICLYRNEKPACFCVGRFVGKNCEFDVDECSLYKPCLNGSQCENTFGSFSCNCSIDQNCYNHTFQELYAKLASQIGHQSTSISSSLSSIIADGRPFQHNSDIGGVPGGAGIEIEERSFLSHLKSKDALFGIIGGILIVVFIFFLVLLISLLIVKLKRIKKQPKIPESTSTSNRDIDDIDEVDDDDDDDNEVKKSSKGFFKRKAKTYSSTSSKKKLVLNHNVKLKLLNNELNMNSVHNTFQREIKLKNYVDQSTTTTKTLEKNLIKEASKKIINNSSQPEKSTSMESLNKSDQTPNIISPDYNYIQLYNSNKKNKNKKYK